MSELIEKARNYAIRCHAQANQNYGDMPYEAHLYFVAYLAEYYLKKYYSIPEHEKEIIIATAWCHDVMEDARQSYNDVGKAVGYDVAEVVRLLTTDIRGRNRSERHYAPYYEAIANNWISGIVKICDRIANVSWSGHMGDPMFSKYSSEHWHFVHYMTSQRDRYGILLQELTEETFSGRLTPACQIAITEIQKRYLGKSRIELLHQHIRMVLSAQDEDPESPIYRALTESMRIIDEMREA